MSVVFGTGGELVAHWSNTTDLESVQFGAHLIARHEADLNSARVQICRQHKSKTNLRVSMPNFLRRNRYRLGLPDVRLRSSMYLNRCYWGQYTVAKEHAQFSLCDQNPRYMCLNCKINACRQFWSLHQAPPRRSSKHIAFPYKRRSQMHVSASKPWTMATGRNPNTPHVLRP